MQPEKTFQAAFIFYTVPNSSNRKSYQNNFQAEAILVTLMLMLMLALITWLHQ